MKVWTKEVVEDEDHKFVITLRGRTLATKYVSTHPVPNTSVYTMTLRVDLTKEQFENCVLNAALYFVAFRKKHMKKVHPLFAKILVTTIAIETNSPLNYVVERVVKQTELAYREKQTKEITTRAFLRQTYNFKKKINELEKKGLTYTQIKESSASVS